MRDLTDIITEVGFENKSNVFVRIPIAKLGEKCTYTHVEEDGEGGGEERQFCGKFGGFWVPGEPKAMVDIRATDGQTLNLPAVLYAVANVVKEEDTTKLEYHRLGLYLPTVTGIE